MSSTLKSIALFPRGKVSDTLEDISLKEKNETTCNNVSTMKIATDRSNAVQILELNFF